MKAMATHLKLEEGIPIESKMLSRMIENAQRKVEARNYDIRKQLLEFDDVQNDQRHEIYKVRNEILDSQDLSESVREMRHGFYSDLVRDGGRSVGSRWPHLHAAQRVGGEPRHQGLDGRGREPYG